MQDCSQNYKSGDGYRCILTMLLFPSLVCKLNIDFIFILFKSFFYFSLFLQYVDYGVIQLTGEFLARVLAGDLLFALG